MKRTPLVALTMLMSVAATAQVIGDRATLNALLVSSTTDDFETYRVAVGSAENLDIWSLDSTSIANGQGPGLVNPGATYSDPSAAQLQWNGDTYFGLTTKTILANGVNGAIRIDYANFTQAMGLDAENFGGYPYDGSMQVWNGATLVDTVNFSLGGGTSEFKFVGYRNDAGITHVILSSPNYNWSPIIDDHTYGVVPEPATLLALGAALAAMVRRRRK